MTELRTLNDFNFKAFGIEDKLKAEAVKWVKDIQKDKEKSSEEKASQMVWIKHFFNLTEEEIKGEEWEAPITHCPLKEIKGENK